MRGIFETEQTYGLPENVYNDVIPSGVHDFNRDDF